MTVRPTETADRHELKASDVEALLPVTIPGADFTFARGIRAGAWVFATGQCGTDYVNDLAPRSSVGAIL